jgi:hypothetical protein
MTHTPPANPPDPLVAFIDESHRHLGGGRYGTVLAAVAIREADEAAAASLARAQLQPGQRRYHWRDEGVRSRQAFVSAFTEQDDVALTIVIASATVERAQRIGHGRVGNLWRLVTRLTELGVGRLVLESREEWNDRHDRREIERARAAGATSHDLVYSHLRPIDDPVLWLADAAAGVASAHLFGGGSQWWDLWQDARRTEIEVLDQRP